MVTLPPGPVDDWPVDHARQHAEINDLLAADGLGHCADDGVDYTEEGP